MQIHSCNNAEGQNKKNGTKPLKPQNWGAGMWFYCPLLNKSSGNQFIYGVLGIKIGNG